MTAAIVQFQKKEDAQFICSACGADRACNCNAPAVEKLAAIVEQRRQARRTYDEKKRQRKQRTSDIRSDEDAADGNAADGATDDNVEEFDDWNESSILPQHLESAFLIRADQARQFATYGGKPTPKLAAMARMVAKAWGDLADTLESQT